MVRISAEAVTGDAASLWGTLIYGNCVGDSSPPLLRSFTAPLYRPYNEPAESAYSEHSDEERGGNPFCHTAIPPDG